jgi:hypothetical protein
MSATRPAILSRDRALYASPYGPLFIDRPHPRGGTLAPAPWVDVTHGAGSVASTGGDMALYLRWLLRAASGADAAPLLSKAGAARYFAASADAPGWAKGARYGSGWAHVQVEGRPLLHHTGGMIGYSSSIHFDPAAGVGCFASSNVGGIEYRPRQITAYACLRLRAALAGETAPTPPPAPPQPEGMADYAGRYLDRAGAALVVAAREGGLSATLQGRALRLEPGATDAFILSDPADGALPLVFRRDGKTIVGAWWGGTEYRSAGHAGAFALPTPPALQKLVGAYESDDPWRGSFHVVAQGPALTLEGLTPLTPLPDGGFRVGADDWSPERLYFDGEIGGVPTRATLSGADFLRRPL